MKTAEADLQKLYQQQLINLIAAEKQHIKSIGKISKAILTDELKTAVNSDNADIQQHLERLQLCKTTLKNRSIPKAEAAHLLTQVVGDYPKTGNAALLLDIGILKYLQDTFMLKLAAYQQLQLMATAIGQDQAAKLMEQSAKDNQNSYAYLQQISANIIYPAVMKHEITSI